MAAVLLDILWLVAAWTVAGLGTALILHALLSDSVRGLVRPRAARSVSAPAAGDHAPAHPPPRLRCPGSWGRVLLIIPWRRGCWYDMGASTPVEDGRHLWPECGRRSTTRQLRKARRHYRLAFLGLLIALGGLGGVFGRDLYRRGWRAVPDAALVLVPFDERAWVEGALGPGSGAHPLAIQAAAELARREDSLTPWAARRLGERLRDRYRRDAAYGVEPADVGVFERLSTTPFTAGVESRPFSEAVARIADAAGVRLELDTHALSHAQIDPDRRITIPPLGLMTCEQALDWACDRTRASRGWSVADWTMRDGSLLVSSDAAAGDPLRTLVLVGDAPALSRPFGPLGRIRSPIVSTGAPPAGSTRTVATTLILTGTSRHVARVQRFMDALERAPAPDALPADAIRALEARLAQPLALPFDAQSNLDLVLHRLRTEAGVPAAIDTWGLDPHRTILEAVQGDDRAPSGFDDPFALSPPEAPGPVASAREALALLGAPYLHDGTSMVLGLRACELLATVAVYPLPTAEPEPGPSLPRDHPKRIRREEFFARIRALTGEVSATFRGGTDGLSPRLAAMHVVGDRLVVWATPDMQVLVQPVIESHLRRWNRPTGPLASEAP